MNMQKYWENRYQKGDLGSGPGSRGLESQHKADLLQSIIEDRHVQSLFDLGCGDGVVMSQVTNLPQYTGYDFSPRALEIAQQRIPHGRFVSEIPDEEFDLVVSMDVMHHLVGDDLYRSYLEMLFSGIGREVFVYGTSVHHQGRSHVLHRNWLPDIPKSWNVRELESRFKRAWLISRS